MMTFNQIRELVTVSNQKLDSIDLSEFKPFSQVWGVPTPNFFERSGESQFRFLINLSFSMNDKNFIVVGSKQSTSSISIGLNPTNKIFCFNKSDETSKFIKQSNINFMPENFIDIKFRDIILNSSLIYFDIELDGEYEKNAFNYLMDIGYKGFIFINGIHLNTDINNFWNSINKEKYDLTRVGSQKGLGFVNVY